MKSENIICYVLLEILVIIINYRLRITKDITIFEGDTMYE